jgi:hypothetical protein
MSAIEIGLAGSVFRARLLDEQAPRTCAALLAALPLDNRAVHAMLSGEMFRTLDRVDLGIAEVEGKVAFQYPGLVVYYPPAVELAICYGNARFRGTAGPVYVTPVAEIQADLDALRAAGSRLQWDGATPITFRRVETEAASPPEAAGGRRLAIELDGVVATARLLQDLAPRTCAQLVERLPLEGPATNTAWSGAVTRFWGPLGGEGNVGFTVDPPEATTQFHWPGYLYYHLAWDGLRLCYGDGQQSGAFSVSNMTPLARLEGDWSALREKAAQLYITGAKPMKLRLLD